MSIQFEKASLCDIHDLTQMRIDFLLEDYKTLSDEQIETMRSSLPVYYTNHLNKDLIVYTAKAPELIACAFLLVIEKPSNPSFINGRTGTILNVYTKPEYRRQGIAKTLMEHLLEEGKDLGLDFVELKATEDGYPLYQAVGFHEEHSKYRDMKFVF